MTLNNNFCENNKFLVREKAIKTQRNFRSSDLEKNSINTFTWNLSQKPIQKVPKLFPNKKNFLQKDPRKNSQRGFPKSSKSSFKEKCPFPQKFSKNPQKFIRKSPKILSKNHPKSPLQKSSKSPLLSQHKSPFYRRRFRKYFQIKKPF